MAVSLLVAKAFVQQSTQRTLLACLALFLCHGYTGNNPPKETKEMKQFCNGKTNILNLKTALESPVKTFLLCFDRIQPNIGSANESGQRHRNLYGLLIVVVTVKCN